MKSIKLKKLKKDNYIFLPLVFLLSVILILIQINIWTGDYSYSNLKNLKEEVKDKKQLAFELEKRNLLLEQKKDQLTSDRSAIEGLARSELGLIKPDETFYRFQADKDRNEGIDFKINKKINE
tara:strand:+ start:464 stop:832 length:369 start_codon:yes stop_codon:yes gene_type:complete